MKKLILFFIVIILAIPGCKDSSNPNENEDNGNGTIQTGETITVTSQPVSSAGGIIAITEPGSPLDGFELTVPENAFDQTEIFTVSYAEIQNHEMGDDYTALTPLITIESNGGYAEMFMTLKIPIELPEGHFAAVYFYDDNTGELEELPVIDISSDFITVASRHFSTYSSLNKRRNTYSVTSSSDIVVFSTLEQYFMDNPVLLTGFNSGVDDWEFDNWGTYIAPGGICAGMSITALWYYLNKRQSEGSLNHKYDRLNNPAAPRFMWYDNNKGLRLASTIQRDVAFTTFEEDRKMQLFRPDLMWKSLVMSFYRSAQPKLVLVYNPATAKGHALVAYKIDVDAKKIYVADPNYPGDVNPSTFEMIDRVIQYTDAGFQPYYTPTKTDSPPEIFTSICFFGLSQYASLSNLNQRWAEFEIGTIGNDRFPSYTLQTYPDNQNVTDGMTISGNSVKVYCSAPQCTTSIEGTGKQPIEVYDQNGVPIGEALSTNQGIVTIPLTSGTNKIGFYIRTMEPSGLDKFIDFKWIDINSNTVQLSIDPANLTGEVNVAQTFTAVTSGTLPSDLKYIWNFGDNTSVVTILNSSTVSHTFTASGNYTIRLNLYDNSNQQLIASASSTALIANTLLSDLLSSKSTAVTFNAEMAGNNPEQIWFSNTIYFSNEYKTKGNFSIIWNGLSFSLDYSYKFGDMYDSTYVAGNLSGTVSADGATIIIYTQTHREESKNTGAWNEKTITIVNLPHFSTNLFGNLYSVSGSGVANFITSLTVRIHRWDSQAQQFYDGELTSINYNSTITSPYVSIQFNK